MLPIETIAQYCAAGLELLGIGVIVTIALSSTVRAVAMVRKHDEGNRVFRAYRHQLVHGTLLGLELLVAADIVHTVAIELSFSSIGVLAAVVLVRTFLSFTLEVEMNNRWPWQPEPRPATKAAEPPVHSS